MTRLADAIGRFGGKFAEALKHFGPLSSMVMFCFEGILRKLASHSSRSSTTRERMSFNSAHLSCKEWAVDFGGNLQTMCPHLLLRLPLDVSSRDPV